MGTKVSEEWAPQGWVSEQTGDEGFKLKYNRALYLMKVEHLKICESMAASHNDRVILAFSAETRQITSQAMSESATH